MVSFAFLRFAFGTFSESSGRMLVAFITTSVKPRNNWTILETELGSGFDNSADINAEVVLPVNTVCLKGNQIK